MPVRLSHDSQDKENRREILVVVLFQLSAGF